jgi:hypothetical protein
VKDKAAAPVGGSARHQGAACEVERAEAQVDKKEEEATFAFQRCLVGIRPTQRTWAHETSGVVGGFGLSGTSNRRARLVGACGRLHARGGFGQWAGWATYSQCWDVLRGAGPRSEEGPPVKHPNKLPIYSKKFSTYSKRSNFQITKYEVPNVQKFTIMAR